jgi:hypothetical protein
VPANPKPCRLTTEQMIHLYSLGLGTHAIADLADRNQSTVLRRLQGAGVQMRPAHAPRLYQLDHAFFDVIDTEAKAYILGFFMADGCVIQHGVRKRLQFHLQLQDAPHLKKMARAMSMTHRIHVRPAYAELAWNSPGQFDALARFGIVPNKSLSGLRYPRTLREDLHRHFIRGLIDGDGSVYQDKFGLCGSSLELLADARDVLQGSVPRLKRLGQVCQPKDDPPFYRWHGYRWHAPALRWLYDGATIALERKLSVVKEHWS